MNLKTFAVVAALASQGCSLLFTRAPEPMAKTGVPCNTSNAPAWLDVTQAASNGLAGLMLASAEKKGNDYGMSATLTASTLVMALVHTVSAAHGFSQVNACKRLREAERGYERAPYEWATPSEPASPPPNEPPFDIEVHTDVIVTPRR